jgi:hypothetical protein
LNRVLLDEGVPRALAKALSNALVPAEPFPNEWKGFTNGRLLAAADSAGYGILLTTDKNLFHQQNWNIRTLAVVVLPNNRLASLLPRVSDIVDTLGLVTAGDIIEIKSNGDRTYLSRPSRTAGEPNLPAVDPFGP